MFRSIDTNPPDMAAFAITNRPSLRVLSSFAAPLLSLWFVLFALMSPNVKAASMSTPAMSNAAQPAEITQDLNTVMSEQFMLGQAEFDWLWWTVYKAKLFHPTGQFDFNSLPGTVLLLNYQMDIDKDDLVEQTMAQWQQLDIGDPQQQKQWLSALAQLWPDVVEGDELIVRVLADGSAEFWFRRAQQLSNLGVIESAEFSRDFLSIWLLDRAEHQEFRLALLGADKEYR
ncbi:chalcone isomerase family protein [Neiella sp. HB171785]|uniref:Chalcone isomerase family protein n=1 Tax=Neiella litorisoli TaxID=2771431 RepID=A0A8J6QHG3_9GAMM|nr:chalcone isomerase family protein [Neiella litorisoli]MBD1388523.1 chalcone isomerase family protein [Neiella litorisoli]